MIKKALIVLSALLFFLPVHAIAETISMPLTVDYPLLRALTVSQAFPEPDETAIILDKQDGCNRVTISQPAFAQENSLIRFEIRTHIRLGKSLGEKCFMPIEWESYLVFHQQPKIDPATWTLSFETVDSQVLDLERKPAKIAQKLFGIISDDVHAYLDDIRIDLAPPVSELKNVFGRFLQTTAEDRSIQMVQSIRSGKAHVLAHAVEIDILMDVEKDRSAAQDGQNEPIAEEQLEEFLAQWEVWDAFLVHIVSSLTSEPLSLQERQILLETLLETRYRFVAGLADSTLKNDFVREQFVAAWKNMAPIFRNHLTEGTSKTILGYLSFFTAVDALSALDDIGPTLGIEISRDGLVRLVHLLADQEAGGDSNILTYGTGVDSRLREVLGMGSPPPALGPAFDAEEFDLIPPNENESDIQSVTGAIGSLFCRPAWASQNKSANSLKEIKTWLFSKDDIESHIDRTQSLLMDAARDTLNKRETSDDYNDFFSLLVMSTAWQESCFRQFSVKREKIVYLRSYNGSSVGIMQINERVWRGMYEPKNLRWDIRYNALAGCEILDLYVTKYLVKKAKALPKMNDETRAGIVYAMYNGGPSQLKKFLDRNAKENLYDSDKLFMEKYVWVKNGQLANLDKCLIGQ